MGASRAVVVYGATGYTGELTCEELARRGIPFVCAGRSRDKLDALLERLRGLGADCEAVALSHDEGELRALLRG
jgi:short subunit dehydrogenase-like uncharacterized protein